MNSPIHARKKNNPAQHDFTVWYLYHSGYAVLMPNCLLLFDYWRDEPEIASAQNKTSTPSPSADKAPATSMSSAEDAPAVPAPGVPDTATPAVPDTVSVPAVPDTVSVPRTLDHGVFDPVTWLDETARNSPGGAIPDVVVFSSHKHGDHFNPLILEWQNTIPTIRYILSHDIPKRHFIGIPKEAIHEAGHPDEQVQTARILRMKAQETLSLPELNMVVRTFRSTDAGVAFWVEINGKVVYHAGDLNLWYWEEESKSWNNNMIARFKQELALMKAWSDQTGKQPDLAFLPVDPRLGKHWLDGYTQFMSQIGAKTAFPMHFGNPASLDSLKEALAEAPERTRNALKTPTKRGERFML